MIHVPSARDNQLLLLAFWLRERLIGRFARAFVRSFLFAMANDARGAEFGANVESLVSVAL